MNVGRANCLGLGLSLLLAGAFSGVAGGADPAVKESQSAVAVTVNGVSIHVNEVQEGLSAVLQGRQVAPDALVVLQAEVLERLIDRQLVEGAVGGTAPPPAEVRAALDKLAAQLAQQKSSLKQLLAERNVGQSTLERQLAWQITWAKYLEKNLTDAELEAYFQAHHQEFDGTEVRVSHILLRPDRIGDPAEANRLLQEAAQLRERIASGKISFADAAAKHSAGPSRAAGGDLGFIPRRGLMAEPFSDAAFRLKRDEISPPVVTTFGVHLIRVTDEKPGSKRWSQVRDELKAPAAEALFETIAKKAQDKAKLQFTGAWPYFKPGTREIVKQK